MPDPIRPGHVSFDISFKKTAPPTPADEDAPLRIAILGHFSGRADAAGSRPLLVDCDNFDSVCAQFAASLHLPACAAGTAEIDLAFKHLDDFHPDQLLNSVPALVTLADLRARLLYPASTEAAVAELRGIFKTGMPASASITAGAPQQESASDMVARLLGRPVTGPSAPAGPKSIVDQLIKQAVAPSTAPPPSPDQASLLATLDSEISARLRRILHRSDFQALESTWRGLDFLVREAGENVKLHAIDISREELDRQISSLDNPAATAVGRQLEPLVPAVILGAFTFGTRDPGTLLRIARLAEACSTAFIGGAKPELLGCNSFGSQPNPLDWATTTGADLNAFAELRRAPESIRIGLALPRFLIRQPYGKSGDPIQTLPFEELTPGDSHECYLWANPAFLCGHLLLRSFASDGWDIELGGAGGEIGGLPVHSFRAGVEKETTPCAEAWLSEKAAEAILSRGLMPVLSVRGRDSVLLVSFRSIADPARALPFRVG